MSFGSDLQGWQSHEALLNIQDTEIFLLDNVRRCIAQRAKCDRDYIMALAAVTSNATQKLGFGCQSDTPMGQIWSIVMAETESLMQLMYNCANQLGTNILDAITQVVSEKKHIRKMYAEKRNSMDMELDRLVNEVNKYKELYEHRLAKLVQNRVKYENVFKKVKTSSRLDEVRAKYIRSEAKVRNTHNCYLLALCEANLYQQQYSCVMLPTLLDAQQGLQEDLVKLCKQILEQYANLTDWSKTQFQEIHSNIRSVISSISPVTEYTEFVAQYRTEPTKFSKHEFQQSIVQNYLPNSPLVSGQILVDESTLECLRQSKTSFTDQLTKCRQRMLNKQKELNDAEKLLVTSASSEDADISVHIEKRTVAALKRDLLELQCQEEKFVALSQLLGEPLSRLGTTRPRPGISELADFGSQLDFENMMQNSPPSAPSPNIHNTLSQLRSTISKHMQFRRSRSSITTLPVPDTAASYRDSRIIDSAEAIYVPADTNSHAGVDVGSNNSQMVAARCADTDPLRDISSRYVELEIRRLMSKMSHSDAQVEPPLTPVVTTNAVVPDNLVTDRSQDSDDDDDLPGIGVGSAHAQPRLVDRQGPAQSDVSLDNEEWFHGVLPRDEVQRLLLSNGDFLVRASSKSASQQQYVLSVKWTVHKHFIIQETPQGGWRLERGCYQSIQHLVKHLLESGEPVTRKSGAILKNPVRRPEWALRNDDIELQLKIGSGQFGEVFRATLKPLGLTVAVKTCHEELGDEVKSKFLQEGRTLKQYDHPNIVHFIGIAASRHPVMIVMEFVPGGSLLSFLRKHGSSQTIKTLVKMCEDAAAGMSYLASQNCIHRDLAARNCLVGDNCVIKISDFGMSRQEHEYIITSGRRQIPIKWTAPEALCYGTYTTASDVWSFGILVWEVFSVGSTPYPGLTNAQASDKVAEGYRMPPTSNMPDLLYDLIMRCWEHEPQDRPAFTDVYQELQKLRSTVC